MPTDAVRCCVDVLVEDGRIEAAIRDLKRRSSVVGDELRRRRRDGPKPSEKRRNKRWFAASKKRSLRWNVRPDDELEQARRDQAMFTARLAARGRPGG